METCDVRLTNIEGVKRLAWTIKKEAGCKYMYALELAARQAGFAHYNAARKALEAAPEPVRLPDPKPQWVESDPAPAPAARAVEVVWKRSRLAPQ